MSNILDQYALPGIVTFAGMYQSLRFAKAVGMARGKYNVKVPETTGPEEFVRIFRAQQNHIEFYPISLASLWMGSVFFHPVPASLLYAGYLAGRERYFRDYSEASDKRLPGFYMSIRYLKGIAVIIALGVGHKAVRYAFNVDLLQILKDQLPALADK